jgi:hypothetical protein
LTTPQSAKEETYVGMIPKFLKPADILLIGGNDSDFIKLEELSEVFVFTREVPAEQTLDDPPHGLEVYVASESEIFIACCSKTNVHLYFVQPPN